MQNGGMSTSTRHLAETHGVVVCQENTNGGAPYPPNQHSLV